MQSKLDVVASRDQHLDYLTFFSFSSYHVGIHVSVTCTLFIIMNQQAPSLRLLVCVLYLTPFCYIILHTSGTEMCQSPLIMRGVVCNMACPVKIIWFCQHKLFIFSSTFSTPSTSFLFSLSFFITVIYTQQDANQGKHIYRYWRVS